MHIVEFADFECRACAKSSAELHDFVARHQNEVRHDFRNLPLPLHHNAKLAARAAVAAGFQGKFWEMHDALFLNQASLEPALIRRLAADLELDAVRFQADLNSPAAHKILAADLEEARRFGILSTPFYIINGKLRGGIKTLKELEPELEAVRRSSR